MKPTTEDRNLVKLDLIREMCKRIMHSMKKVGIVAFMKDLELYDATVKRLEVIGEAATELSPDAKACYDLEWDKIIAFRHLAVHHYAKLSSDQIHEIATIHIPRMWNLIKH
jgi:uncharacterized protein with HEPN domain